MGRAINSAGLGLLLCLCWAAQAENDTGGTAWELDNLQKQRVLYEAEAAMKKAKAAADSVGGSVRAEAVGAAQRPGEGTGSGNGEPAASPQTLPRLVKISGRNAVISLPDGNTTTVSAGQMLPGNRWQVVSVSLNGVKVRDIATRREDVLN